jgi:mannose-6-phosphate isomerase-like protein (cupin superfamily)
VTLRRDAQMEVVAVRWLPGAASRLHGHGRSAAVYTVVSGTIEEERYLPEGDGYRYEVSVLRAGQATTLPPGAYHRIRSLADAVSVHVYTPPPEDPTAVVPAEVAPVLEQARQRALARSAG